MGRLMTTVYNPETGANVDVKNITATSVTTPSYSFFANAYYSGALNNPASPSGGGGGAATIPSQQTPAQPAKPTEQKKMSYTDAVSKYNSGSRSADVIDVLENSRMGLSREEYDIATKKFKEERDIVGTGAYIAASRGITPERQAIIRQTTGIQVPDYVAGYGSDKYWKDIEAYTATAKNLFPDVKNFAEQKEMMNNVTIANQKASASMAPNFGGNQKITYRAATQEDIASGKAVGIEDPTRGISTLGVIMSPADVKQWERSQYEENLVIQARKAQAFQAGLPLDTIAISYKQSPSGEWSVKTISNKGQFLVPREGMGSVDFGLGGMAGASAVSVGAFGAAGRPGNWASDVEKAAFDVFIGGTLMMADLGTESLKTFSMPMEKTQGVRNYLNIGPVNLGSPGVRAIQKNPLGFVIGTGVVTGGILMAQGSSIWETGQKAAKGEPYAIGTLASLGLMAVGPEAIGKAGKTAARPLEIYNAFAEGKPLELKFTPIERINWAGETEFSGTRSIQFQKVGYGLDIIRINDKSLTSPKAIFGIRGLAPMEETGLVKANIPEFMGRNLETAELQPYRMLSFKMDQGLAVPTSLTEFTGKLPTPYDVTEGNPFKTQAPADVIIYGYGKGGITKVRGEGVIDYEAARRMTLQDLPGVNPGQSLVRFGEKEVIAGGIYKEKGGLTGIEFERLWSREAQGQPIELLSGQGVFKGKITSVSDLLAKSPDFIQVVIREKAYETERVKGMTSPKFFNFNKNQKLDVSFGESVNLGKEFKKTPLKFERPVPRENPPMSEAFKFEKGGDVISLSKEQMNGPRLISESEAVHESYDVISKMSQEMFGKEQQRLMEAPRMNFWAGDLGKSLFGLGGMSKTQPRMGDIFGEGRVRELTAEQPRVADLIGLGVGDVFKGITGPREINLQLPRVSDFVGVSEKTFDGQTMKQIQTYGFDVPRPGEVFGGEGPPGPEPPRIDIPAPFMPGFPAGVGVGKIFEQQARHGFKTAYNPSLLAFAFDIKATRAPAMTFGLEVRPIIVGASRKKKSRRRKS